MAFLEEAFNTMKMNASERVVELNVIGSAYGPQYSSGLSANGVYKVYRDPKTSQLYIDGSEKREYVDKDGGVVGNKGKSYTIRLH